MKVKAQELHYSEHMITHQVDCMTLFLCLVELY